MFSFDGDFRRRPQQNFGGASQKSERDELIRKAQFERQKREETRRRHNGAIVIQSHIRSFLWRQRLKKIERQNFDDYLKNQSGEIRTIEDLTFLLKKILFFYYIKDSSDCERLILVSQSMLRNPGALISISLAQAIWQHRIKKLLALCIDQIFVIEFSPAIPFRILEIFTSYDEITIHYSEDGSANLQYLANVFSYLIGKKYFKKIRRLINERVPPTDGPVTVPPNPMSEIILKLLVRPLILVEHLPQELANEILYSFISNILSTEFTEPIKHFILPTLAELREFPYVMLIRCLSEFYQNEMDIKNTILVDIEEHDRFDRKKRNENIPIFSTFLLCSILRLDNLYLGK